MVWPRRPQAGVCQLRTEEKSHFRRDHQGRYQVMNTALMINAMEAERMLLAPIRSRRAPVREYPSSGLGAIQVLDPASSSSDLRSTGAPFGQPSKVEVQPATEYPGSIEATHQSQSRCGMHHPPHLSAPVAKRAIFSVPLLGRLLRWISSASIESVPERGHPKTDSSAVRS
jgi:hypothetical protein